MKPKQKGSALFVAIMFSFIGLLIIAGLVAVWYRLTHIIFPVKTYSSVREAAAGGVKLLSAYVDLGYFLDIQSSCPSELNSNRTSLPNLPYCCKSDVPFKLVYSNNTFYNHVTICLLRPPEPAPGYPTGGTTSNIPLLFLYGFNSTAIGLQNETAHVEAVYTTVLFVNIKSL